MSYRIEQILDSPSGFDQFVIQVTDGDYDTQRIGPFYSQESAHEYAADLGLSR